MKQDCGLPSLRVGQERAPRAVLHDTPAAQSIRVTTAIAGWDDATADALIARGADPREVAAQFREALAEVQ